LTSRHFCHYATTLMLSLLSADMRFIAFAIISLLPDFD
jgi:hypothetical protein